MRSSSASTAARGPSSWNGAVGRVPMSRSRRMHSASSGSVIAGEGYRPARMLALHDTLRGRIVPFRPRGKTVTLYVCGVTPYDTTHLGHARTFLVFDVLVRHLEASGLHVRYAQN